MAELERFKEGIQFLGKVEARKISNCDQYIFNAGTRWSFRCILSTAALLSNNLANMRQTEMLKDNQI